MIVISLTVLIVTAIAAWLIRDLVTNATSTRIVLADKARQTALLEARAAASATQLTDATRSLRQLADRLAPAPARAGKPATIHTRDERTITGVLLEEFADRTRLGDARYVTAAGETPVPGGVATVLKINEAWRQEHTS